jgi:hypothetical protein
MTADIVKLPPPDPVFALVPELKLHLSEIDGAFVTNSREVARVFFRDDHQALIRHIMWSISCDRSVWPQWHDEFRMCADGTVDMTSRGLNSALSHWGFEYEDTPRHREFTHAWIEMVCAKMREIEAKTGINPVIGAFKKFFPDIGMGYVSNGEFRQCCCECDQSLPAGPVLHDELWATIARHPDAYLCFDCTETRLGRGLTQADLKVCPFNAGWISFDGADVAAMQFARGRRLLPPGEAVP